MPALSQPLGRGRTATPPNPKQNKCWLETPGRRSFRLTRLSNAEQKDPLRHSHGLEMTWVVRVSCLNDLYRLVAEGVLFAPATPCEIWLVFFGERSAASVLPRPFVPGERDMSKKRLSI